MFGRIIGRMRHAAVVFGVMLVLLLVKITGAVYFETAPTQAFAGLPIEQNVGNLEGKELRFGAASGPTWAVLTTSTSNGSVGAMHDSLNPLTGLMPMIGMWLNATFGGVGVGMINMFLYIVVAVFLAGMMVGRTPEYLGRRVEAREVKLAILALFAHGLFILGGTALFAATPWGAATLNNVGPHGFSEILYEFSSASANNGSGFEGLGDNTVPWNIATGIVMLLARFIPIILPLAIVGSLMAKRRAAEVGRHARRGGRHLRRHADRDDRDLRRADLLPRRDARADRRTPDLHGLNARRTATCNRFSPASASSSPPCSSAWSDTPR